MFSETLSNQYKRYIVNNIKTKGFAYTFFRLIKKLISFEAIIIYPLTFILCILIRIIKPIFFIRFGCMYAAKYGPLSANTEMNLCEQELGLQPKNTDTFNIYHTGSISFICNKQLFKMWKRIVRVYPKSRYFWNVMNSFSFGKEHIIQAKKGSRDIYNLLERSPIHLSFTKEETKTAKKSLLKMGLNKNDKFILIINRTQRYLDETLPGNLDLTHNSFRNSSINDLLPAAEMLVSKGNTIIRLGEKVGDILKTKNSKIIDYDRRGFRTELLDIYLSANCKYTIGASDTGGLAVAGWNFRKPMININFSSIEHLVPWLPSWLFCFRKYWLKDEKRFMKIKEMINSGAGSFYSYKQYEKKGIELINNSKQQIMDVVNEMELRLAGNWQDNDDDKQLQNRFWSHFKSSKYHGIVRSRIGANFLRENKDLL